MVSKIFMKMQSGILIFNMLLLFLFMNCWNDYDKMMAKENGKCKRQKQEEAACRVLIFSDCTARLGHSGCSAGYFVYNLICERTTSDCKDIK